MTSRKERTRTRLQATALDLFERDGFDRTTVASIAAAAGVTEMTFFRHFPTKEAVVLDDPYDPLLAAAVAAQPADLPAVVRVAGGLVQAWQAMPPPTTEETIRRVEVVVATPALRAGIWRNTETTLEFVTERLCEQGVPRATARAATAAVLAAVTEGIFEWARCGGVPDLRTAVLDAVATVVAR